MSERSLIEFVKWAITEGPFEGCHLDGGSIQDKAEKLGILIKTKYDRTKHGESAEADDGDDWYEFAPWLALPPLRAREEIARDDALRSALEPFVRFYDDIRFNLRKQPHPTDPAIDQNGERYSCLTWAHFYALKDALSSTAGQEWRDISTVSVAEFDEHNPVLIGWWSRSFSPHETREWQWVQAYWTGEEWDAGEYEIDHCKPTHYLQPQLLPLPAPPVAEPLLAEKSEVKP